MHFSSGHQKEMKETLRVYRLHKLRIRQEMFTVSLMASLALIVGNAVSHEGLEPAGMEERRLPWTDWMDCVAPEAKLETLTELKWAHYFSQDCYWLLWQEPDIAGRGLRKDRYWILDEAQSGGTLHSLLIKRHFDIGYDYCKKYFCLGGWATWHKHRFGHVNTMCTLFFFFLL